MQLERVRDFDRAGLELLLWRASLCLEVRRQDALRAAGPRHSCICDARCRPFASVHMRPVVNLAGAERSSDLTRCRCHHATKRQARHGVTGRFHLHLHTCHTLSLLPGAVTSVSGLLKPHPAGHRLLDPAKFKLPGWKQSLSGNPAPCHLQIPPRCSVPVARGSCRGRSTCAPSLGNIGCCGTNGRAHKALRAERSFLCLWS